MESETADGDRRQQTENETGDGEQDRRRRARQQTESETADRGTDGSAKLRLYSLQSARAGLHFTEPVIQTTDFGFVRCDPLPFQSTRFLQGYLLLPNAVKLLLESLVFLAKLCLQTNTGNGMWNAGSSGRVVVTITTCEKLLQTEDNELQKIYKTTKNIQIQIQKIYFYTLHLENSLMHKHFILAVRSSAAYQNGKLMGYTINCKLHWHTLAVKYLLWVELISDLILLPLGLGLEASDVIVWDMAATVQLDETVVSVQLSHQLVSGWYTLLMILTKNRWGNI